MKLPEDVVISEDKLVRYLLLPRQESDKSQFLGLAGYTLATWEVLARDLHHLAQRRTKEKVSGTFNLTLTIADGRLCGLERR